jgi:hypothetical protein
MVNIINTESLKLLNKVKLNEATNRVFAFDSQKAIQFNGKFSTKISTAKTQTTAEFLVIDRITPNIIGFKTALELGIIKIINNINEYDGIKSKYRNLFRGGTGCLKDFELKIFVNENIQPTRQQHHRIPFHLREQLSNSLRDDEKNDLIERADGPTTWISSTHVVPKKDPGKVRLVINATGVNKAIKRHRHITPTIDDLVVKLNGSTVFSKIDFTNAYRQIKLHPDSRHLTTFSTHEGLWRDKRLNFGYSSAAESFQYVIQSQVLHGFEGVFNVSDDIIVYGKSKSEHDERLHQLLERLNDSGMTANEEKCSFGKESINFYGVNFSANGMAPSTERIKSLSEAKRPESNTEVRSFLATANYSARFIKNFSSITQPLRDLSNEKNVQFKWDQIHQEAFQKTKESLTSECLRYFNPLWETEVICDASPVGLGAILVQTNPDDRNERYIVAFASKVLSKLEMKYSQVEREALALVYACKKFHIYLIGKRFTLFSDAKAIVFIYGNGSNKTPARIERWGLRLLPYDFKLQHISGESNPADYLSRHPIDKPTTDDDDAESYVNFIVDHSIPKAITRDEIASETKRNSTLQSVIKAIEANDRQLIPTGALKQFGAVFGQLSVSNDGIILRQHQIVLPHTLAKKAINIAHSCHMGIVKTKALMREKVWFPNMNLAVENAIGSCITCLAFTKSSNNIVPMERTTLPDGVWHTVSVDFHGPLSGGRQYLLVVMDKFSSFPIVEVVSSTSADCTLVKLDKIFGEFGTPTVLKSDNGPPFQSIKFKEYLDAMGIKHHRSTPYWPRGNARCERFMKNLVKVIRIANVERKPWIQLMNNFLRSYRATPHSTTKVSPASLMFQRNDHSLFPTSEIKPILQTNEEIKQRHEASNEKNKINYDHKLSAKESSISIGDMVLVKQIQKNKSMPPYNPNKLQVTKKKGSWIVATGNDGKEISRNVSFFKRIPNMVNNSMADKMVEPIDSENSKTQNGREEEEDIDALNDSLSSNTDSENGNPGGNGDPGEDGIPGESGDPGDDGNPGEDGNPDNDGEPGNNDGNEETTGACSRRRSNLRTLARINYKVSKTNKVKGRCNVGLNQH